MQDRSNSTYKSTWSSGTRLVVITVVVAIVISVFGIYTIKRWRSSAPPFENVQVSKLTTSGNIVVATLSPDAQLVAYAVKEAEKQRLLIKPVAFPNKSTEIAGALDAEYHGLTFSPDGNFIYFVRSAQAVGSIYRLNLRGGEPVELFRDVESSICLSPDGQLLAYVRRYPEQKETVLILGRADGSGERKLASLKEPASAFVLSGGPSWSPNGKLIATAATHQDPTGAFQDVLAVSVLDGSVNSVGTRRFQKVGRVAWFADGKSLAIAAVDQQQPTSQLWKLAYPSGETRRITNDQNEYQQATLSKDSRQLVAVQGAPGEQTGDVVLLTENKPESAPE